MTTATTETNASILTEQDQTAWRLTMLLVAETATVTTAIEVDCADKHLADLTETFSLALRGHLGVMEDCHPSVSWHFANEVMRTTDLLVEIGKISNETALLASEWLNGGPEPDENDMVGLMMKHLLALTRNSTEVLLATDYDRARDYSEGLISAHLAAATAINGDPLPENYLPLAMDLMHAGQRSAEALDQAGYVVF